jgi:small subunit ribosomal protein S16
LVSMVKIRLMRLGRKKRPFYRMVVTNDRTRRDGAPIAELGFYDPIAKQLKINKALALEWIGKGAQPSDTALRLIGLASDTGEVVMLPKKELKHLAPPAPAKEEVPAKAEPTAKVEDAPVAAEPTAAAVEAPAEVEATA